MNAATQSQSTTLFQTFFNKLIALFGPDHVRAAGLTDAVAGAQPKVVVAPANENELAEVLRLSNEANLAVVPRGGGTKLGWGNPPSRADLILSTARMNEITEHAWADLTVTVEAGCTIQKLQQTLAQHGQRLALDTLWPEKATVGGVLSTNDSGSLRLRFGALRDLIIGVTLALPDGTLASSGGKVVKNVAGYDLPKLAAGAFGTLGIITRTVFRLHPLPRYTRSFFVATTTPKETCRFIHVVQDSKLAHTALQTRFEGNVMPLVDVLFEGTEAGLSAQESHLRKLAGTAPVIEVSSETWGARQNLWSFSKPESTAIAKISILPAEIDGAMESIAKSANTRLLQWKAVLQATGIGLLRLEGDAKALRASLQELRDEFERSTGSLVVLHKSASMASFDAWGDAGDALPLMKAIKHQLDPKNTLNPGRFVGGI